METKNSEAQHSADNQPKLALDPIKSLFADSWKFFGDHFNMLAEIVLVPILVLLGGQVISSLGVPFNIIGGIMIAIGQVLLSFSILPLIYSIVNHKDVDTSYRATISLFWPFAWIAILEFFAVMGGFVMLVVPAIWLGIALTFVTYTLVIEGRRGIDALRQSVEYVRGYWWALLGRIILFDLVVGIASVAVAGIFAIIGGSWMSQIVSAAITLVVVPFSVVFRYKLYENLHILKPHLAAEKDVVKGRKFLVTAATLGMFALAALIIVVIALVARGVIKSPRVYMQNGTVAHWIKGS